MQHVSPARPHSVWVWFFFPSLWACWFLFYRSLSPLQMHTAAQGGRGQCSDKAFCLCLHSSGGGGRRDETLWLKTATSCCSQIRQTDSRRERNRQKGEVEKKWGNMRRDWKEGCKGRRESSGMTFAERLRAGRTKAHGPLVSLQSNHVRVLFFHAGI